MDTPRWQQKFLQSICYGVLTLIFNAAIGLLLLLPAQSAASEKRLLLFGDSLIAGYGLPVEDGLASSLKRSLTANKVQITIINGGVSGDTTAGGRARASWLLGENPTHAILALGANDALRGIDPEQTRSNLTAILNILRQAGVHTLLVGMRAPRNWGEDYANAFDKIYPDLANLTNTPLYPFFLEGVALNPDLNQSDGIHPNASGVAFIVKRILPQVKKLLDQEPTR